MSWAQQREAIRIAAEAGVRARTSAAGSETLPLTHHHLRYAMLSRPNGELTRAGQYYYQLIGRPPPSRQYDRNQPLIREGPNDYIMIRGGAKKLLRSLQPNGNYHLTKLGKSFFKDKWVDWVVHVPVIIRGIRRNGRNRGMRYERTKRLPVTDLNVTLSRQSEGLSDAQAARNLKASALAQLGNPEPNDIIWELSDETYYLDATREWTFSQQAMQVVDDQVVLDTVLDQPLGVLREVSYQLYCGDEILESAFEQRPDKLCVPRQLAELMRLPLQEVLSDFDAICTKKTWREQGITPREIREFCLWRQAPMFYVDCQGRLLDKYEPTVKEQRAVAFTSWNGHAFFYKSARTVAKCEPIGERARYRGERKPGETPEFKHWREWEGEVASGHFYTEDLEQVRRELLAEGHCPKVVMRSMSEWRCLRLRVRGGEDCVISTFHEDLDGAAGAPLLRAASGGRRERGLPSPSQGPPRSARISASPARGAGPPVQALRGPHHRNHVRVGPHRPRAPVLRRTGPEPPGTVPRVPPEQNGPGVLARHDTGVALQPAGLRAVRGIASTPTARLQAQQPQAGPHLPRYRRGAVPQERSGPCQVPRAHLLPQGQRGASPRRAPGGPDLREAPGGRALGGVQAAPLRRPGLVRQACGGLHAGKGPCDMERLRVQPGRHGARGPGVRGSGPAENGGGLAGGRGALREAVGECPHRALGTQHEPHLHHAHQQPPVRRVRVPAPGAVPGRRGRDALGSHLRDPVVVQPELPACARLRDGLGVRRRRDALATVPSRYLKAVKTDCVVFQDLPKKFQRLVDSLVRERHPDGTPVYRCEEVKGLEGQYRIPRIEAEWMCNIDTWKVAEELVLHCLEGGSLLLTGYPGTGKTHLARQIVTALREEGYKVKIITKTHSSVQNFGMQAETADHWVRSTVRNGYCNIDWLVVEEITQLDTGLWNDIACVSMNRKVKFLLLGDFRQFPAVMDNFAGTPVQRELKHCQLLHDLTDGWHHELTENRRSDPGIFDFLRWLRVDEPREQSLPEAVRAARERFPRQGEPDVSLGAGQPSPGPAGSCDDRVHRHWPDDHQHAADHAGLARPEAHGRRRPRDQRHLRACGRSGPREDRLGRRRLFHPCRPPETHPAVPRHHLRLVSRPDARRAGLPVRHREPALHPQAPLCGEQQGHQQRAPERALERTLKGRGFGLSQLQVRHFHQKPALARH
ncbi:unnamed protein product [Symbiodinium natans]|uniref:AAA+ ATPase domain-containing protein n=1 Tax=Symbiodinium natans TaxID=878477 RepID=A0A812GNC0_9DINO|nr:unnamed protein product [Symbiodinium natans]